MIFVFYYWLQLLYFIRVIICCIKSIDGLETFYRRKMIFIV